MIAVACMILLNVQIHASEKTAIFHGTGNWAGYAVRARTFSQDKASIDAVQGSWTVPEADCSSTPTGYSSFWIGIDGYRTKSVEQIGTESDCVSGEGQYYAWYEMYPDYSYKINSIRISPGDVMQASVRYLGDGQYNLSITDITTDRSFSVVLESQDASRGSAEWIAEIPSNRDGLLPLADFGSVMFTDASVTAGGTSLGIGSGRHYTISMADSVSSLSAEPSELSDDGAGFSVDIN